MSALEIPLDDVDDLLVRARKAGLDPVYHVPDPENPTRPLCNKNDGSGKGYKPAGVDPLEIDEARICGSCANRDKTTDHRRRVDLVLAREDVTSIEDARRALEEASL